MPKTAAWSTRLKMSGISPNSQVGLRHDLVVYDPQIGTEIDLHNPGDFPPMWAPKKEQSERGHGWFPWESADRKLAN